MHWMLTADALLTFLVDMLYFLSATDCQLLSNSILPDLIVSVALLPPAAPARMMFAYAQEDFEDIWYEDGKKWFAVDKPELLKINPMMNLPYLLDGNLLTAVPLSILPFRP